MTISNSVKRIICLYLVITLVFQIIYPTAAVALTAGPTQPEMQGFTPVGTSDMVDVFSGDFKYNIPLLDVGGYPLNISYNAGQGMDAEASWVGLGWSLVPGNINRNMRGLPDDFKNDKIEKTLNMKPNLTYGLSAGGTIEFAEVPLSLDIGLGLTYNNYNGFGFMMSANPAITAGEPNKTSTTFGLGLSAGSESGVGIQPNVSYDKRTTAENNKDYTGTSTKVGLGFNSRAGLTELTISREKVAGQLKTITNNSKDHKRDMVDHEKANKGGRTSLTFASPSYIPASGKNFLNVSLGITAKTSGSIFFLDGGGYLTGSFSGQYLINKQQEEAAYGYLHMHEANENALLDFNREKDGAVGPHTPNLPLASATYDIYSVTGQGIGGMYRPYMSTPAWVHDKASGSTSGSLGADVGLEFGAGNAGKLGVNVDINTSLSESGSWVNDNEFLNRQNGFANTNISPDYEVVYFKQAGEKTAETDLTFFDDQGGFDADRIDLKDIWGIDVAEPTFINQKGQPLSVNGKIERKKRARRNEVINPLTVEQAQAVAHIKTIENFAPNTFTLQTSGTKEGMLSPRTYSGNASVNNSYPRSVHPASHISEIDALRTDGARYVYGIPAYNNVQEETTFNVSAPDAGGSGRVVNGQTGLIDYYVADDSPENTNGIDHYYERVKTPKYAHSYLLTEVLSADYVDLTDDGPSDDDLGSYTKINYSKVSDNYKWRVPYAGVNYSEGSLSDRLDNKANYLYGEKEIWYVHSIETKNFIAEFHLGDRYDAYGTLGKQGGGATTADQKNYKLDKIVLYAKADKLLEAKGQGHVATPVKTVHFEYDYSLCRGTANNLYTINNDPGNSQSGKLTLKSISFTYGNSGQGKLSPYKFFYGDTNHNGVSDPAEAAYNPDYKMKATDRWGNYKPVPPVGSTFKITDDNGLLDTQVTEANTAEFPYTPQDKKQGGNGYLADDYALAWNLSTIQLPSGGQINVEYESDDYAYVQNKRAMQMFKVSGVGSDNTGNTTTQNADKLYVGDTKNTFIYFDVDRSYSNDEFRKKFLEDENGELLKFLYFKFLMNINRNDDAAHQGNYYEYVPGYVEISTDPNDYGMCPNQSNRAFVRVKEVNIQDKLNSITMVNPISQAGWNYARLYTPRLAFAQSNINDGSMMQIFTAMKSTFKSIGALVQGMNNSLRLKNVAQTFIRGRSFIRLYCPGNFKKGGGYRVKELRLSDNWLKITGPNTGNNNPAKAGDEYGQEYTYTTTNASGESISSGVASYEPGIGADENPWKQPVFFEKKNLLAANDQFFQEEPYGESFFPSPSIGYSRVTVKNLKVQGLGRRATGKVVHEFYTGKDFPVFVSKTSVESKRFNPSPILKLLKVGSRDFYAASQGYTIELNDMHGKPRAEWVYQEDKAEPISGTTYTYYQQAPDKLDNNVLTINKNGNIVKAMVGVDYDMTVDMRESMTESQGFSSNANGEVAIFGIIPVPLPLLLFLVGKEKVRSRLATTTKVINRYGILEKTTAYDLGASVSTINALFDAETGEVIATQTTNEFSDNLYAFNYPAHWRYDGMAGAYKNIGVKYTSFAQASSSKLLYPGDEVYVKGSNNTSTNEKAWVTALSPLKLQRADGSLIVDFKELTVIRSGHRNQQTISIGSISSKKQPWNSDASGNYSLNINSGIDIISAGAVELTDETKIYCECLAANQTRNDYVVGLKGNWRQLKSYTYLTDRTQSRVNDNLNVRTDGVFSSFSPFYTPAGGTTDNPLNWNKNTLNWTSVNEVTIFSPYGNELENKDALNRYSAALFGYGNSLPTAVSSQAAYNQIAADNFEDYDFKECKNDHLGFKPGNQTNVKMSNSNWQKFSHTGKRSIRIPQGQVKSITKTLSKCN